jgi:hypothetical protein
MKTEIRMKTAGTPFFVFCCLLLAVLGVLFYYEKHTKNVAAATGVARIT